MNTKQGVSRGPVKVLQADSIKGGRQGGFEFWFDPDYLARHGAFGKNHPLYNTPVNGRPTEESTEEEYIKEGVEVLSAYPPSNIIT
jgi:hypothetical protein